MKVYDYNAKPGITIKKHGDDLLSRLSELKELGYIKDERIYNLAKVACKFHDYGKANPEFQKRVNSITKIKMNREKEIFHNVLSMLFLKPEEFSSREDYLKVLFVIAYHHDYCSNVLECLEEEKELINTLLLEFKDEIESFNRVQIRKLRNEILKDNIVLSPDTIWIKGLLHKCDYSASAGYTVEYKNDFLSEALNNLLIKWKTKKSTVKWNELQEFCKKNSDSNIIAVAQTGMGKTEAGLHWIGDKKGFFILPLRTAINAMYDRVVGEILENNESNRKVSLLHSESMEYYLQKYKSNEEMDRVEYNKRGRQLSMPLTITTMDQLFDFVYKYQGYELKLVTLAYSKLVIDEIQMYSPQLLAYIFYGIDQVIKLGGKVAIVTATFPPFMQDLLSNIQGEQRFKYKEFTDNSVRHHVKAIDDKMNPEDIINQYKRNKSFGISSKILVVCNRVIDAQNMYDKMIELLIEEEKAELHILHSRYTREDRSKLEKEIMKFGKSYNDNGKLDVDYGIWISTSLVEASLDIDFDYLYTELQDLNSLFQRFGRCNRKGKKLVDEVNCFVYCKCENSGIFDEEMYEMSKKTFLECENTFLQGRTMSESEKIDMIKSTFTYKNMKDTDFMKTYWKEYDDIKELKPYSIEKNEVKLRDISTIDIIPLSVYEDKKTIIQDYIKNLHNKDCDEVKRIELIAEIKKYTVSIPSYQYYNYFKADKSNSLGTAYEIQISEYDRIPVMDCNYDIKGFSAKKFEKATVEPYFL